MRQHFTESVVEEAAMGWLESLGWTLRHGPEIAPGDMATVTQACRVLNSVDEHGRQRYSGTQGNNA